MQRHGGIEDHVFAHRIEISSWGNHVCEGNHGQLSLTLLNVMLKDLDVIL